MDPYANARTKLQALVAAAAQDSDMNEATTRLRRIDVLLFDCLGWNRDEVVTEGYFDGEYVDYALGKGATEAIVEAKREGVAFRLPAGVAGRQSVEMQTLLEDEATAAAIRQVLSYCQQRGVPVGIIANGHQLVAFYASRQDGVPPLRGRSLCFSSLGEMLDNFSTLWTHLSRDGMASKNLQRVLLGAQSRALPPAKLANEITNYPGFRGRTALETDLKILGGLFIQDLESEESLKDEFLRECYCSSGALSQYALVSKEILKARYQAIEALAEVSTTPARTKRGVSQYLSADVISAAMSRRPLIILGDVGVGKSMFIKHLIRIDAAEALGDSLVFYINFGTEPALETDLEQFIYKRITEQLMEDFKIDIYEQAFVRAAYSKELKQFRSGIYKSLQDDDPAEFRRQELRLLEKETSSDSAHLWKSLEHIRQSKRRSAVIVLDNIDQRPAEFQDRVFVIAQSLADTWPATVFVSLRPSTFYASKSKGSLAAYQLRVFTVLPTRVDDVVLKRLQFARKQLERADEAGVFPSKLSLSADDLLAYMDVLLKAFTENDDLKRLLDNISGGNLRLALTYLSAFVGSGYVSIQRVLDVARSGGVYTLPMHEFLRSIIFGEYDYFDPSASDICNLFDTSFEDGREHFLLPMLVSFIQRVGESTPGDGYVEISDVYQFGQGAGYDQEQIGSQLTRAIDKRLLEAPAGHHAGGPYRITNVGSYMVHHMVKHFAYVDAMIVDTPIVDIATRRAIHNVQSIIERLDRAEIFIDYLDKQWQKAGHEDSVDFDWPSVSTALKDDISGARERAVAAARRHS
ncbi:hypothetical protein GCM10027194_03520 [Thalassiella azotivora]